MLKEIRIFLIFGSKICYYSDKYNVVLRFIVLFLLFLNNGVANEKIDLDDILLKAINRPEIEIEEIHSLENQISELQSQINLISESNLNINLVNTGSDKSQKLLTLIKKQEVLFDKLIQLELNEIVEIQRNIFNVIKSEINTQGIKSERVNEILESMDSEIERYYINVNEYGGPKDYKRYASFVRIFKKTQSLLAEIEKLNDSHYLKYIVRPLEGFLSTTRNSLQTLKVGIYTLPGFAKLANSIAIVSGKDGKNSGIGTAGFKIFEDWGKASGIKTEVSGSEYLEKNSPSKVRIYVPTHRDANLDSVALAPLKPRDPIIFGALNLEGHPVFGVRDNNLLDNIVKRIEANDAFILAGSKTNPTEKYLEVIREGKASEAVIYSEGQVALGIKETRPVREKFSTELINRLLLENIDFELVPVTYENAGQNFRWNDGIGKMTTEKGDEILKVKVHEPIDHTEIAKLKKVHGIENLNHLIRSIWHQNLPTDENHLLGKSRWSLIKEAFIERSQNRSTCRLNVLRSLVGKK